MNSKKRQGTVAHVSKVLGRTSPLVVVVTAGLLSSARAQQGDPTPEIPSSPLPNSPNDINAPRTEVSSLSRKLRVPLGALDEKDSELLRQLLLSHGIELDLSDPTIVDETLADLIEEMRLGNVLDRDPDFELVLADASDLFYDRGDYAEFGTDVAESGSYHNVSNNPDFITGVSREWKKTWIDLAPNPTWDTEWSEPWDDPEWRKIWLTSDESPEWIQKWATTGVSPEWKRKWLDNSLTAEWTQQWLASADSAEWKKVWLAGNVAGDTAPTAMQSAIGAVEVSKEWNVKWLTAREPTAAELEEINSTNTEQALAELGPNEVSDSWKVSWQNRPTSEDQSSSQAQIPTLPEELSVPDVDRAPVSPGSPIPTLASPPRGQVERHENPPDAAPIEGSEGGFTVGDDVPPGFEALAGPQTAFVDIYLNERKVGSSLVTATADTFSVDDPSAVAEMLKGVKDPVLIAQYLSEPLPTNADKICYADDDPPGCGQLDPSTIGGIYNQDDLRLDLFVARDLQTIQSAQSIRYLPPPETENTSILSVYAVASALEGEDSDLDLSGRALTGYGKGAGSVLTELDYNTRTDRQRLRQLKLTHYLRDHEIVAGSYSFSPGGALTDVSLLGLSFATSLKTRVDLEHAFSTELVVFLNRRSVVQLAVNDRIYSGASYAAGNRALDTSALPDGTYEVELRILDPVNGSRVERRVFTKSTQIPPRGETIYNVTAGVPLLFNENHIFPTATSTGVIGFSLSKRLTDQSAYGVGFLQFGLRSFLQTEFIYLGRSTSFQIENSVGEDNTLATSARLSYFKDSFSTHLSAKIFRSDADTTDDEVLSRLLPGDFSQLSFSMNKSIGKHNIGLRSSLREETETGAETRSEQYAIQYRRPLFRRRLLRAFLDVSLQKDDVDRRINFQVRVFLDRENWGHSLLSETAFNDENQTFYNLGVSTDWQRGSGHRYDWGFGAHGTLRDNGQDAGIRASLDHPWYLASASTDWRRENSNESLSSVATFNAHLGADRRGVALGGADFAQAGIIVAVSGNPVGGKFDILINGAKTSTGEIGTTQFIGLQPFELYTVKLIPQTVLSNGIGEEIYEFSLYPGSVQRIDVEAKQQVLMIATLVNKYGELIEDAVAVIDQAPILIEAGGFLQAEVTPGAIVRVRPSTGPECEFVVPEAIDEDVMVLDTPLLCTELAES